MGVEEKDLKVDGMKSRNFLFMKVVTDGKICSSCQPLS